jgi:hypothetical protein
MKGNSLSRSVSGFRTILQDLETPIFYAMAIVASVIGILVWGATKIGRPGGGLFHQFKSVFGTEYGILFMVTIVVILFANRRWKGIVITAGAWLLMAMLELNPNRSVAPGWDEFFALGTMLSALILAFCVRYELLD